MRPIMAGKLTLTEAKSAATLDDVIMLNAMLDMESDMQEMARRAADAKRESER